MLSIIKQYLSIARPDYGVMLTGSWGIGKSYWIRNVLVPEVQKLSFLPIYLSLTAVVSVEVIERAIILTKMVKPKKGEIYNPWLIDSVLQITQSIPGASNVTNALLPLVKSIGKNISKNLSFERSLIILDDIERLPEHLSANDLIGAITQRFVELGNAHLLVVGNLDKLLPVSHGFNSNREKYLRIIIQFKPDYQSQFKELTTSISDNELRNHFLDALSYYTSLVKEVNLRMLQFVIDKFSTYQDLLLDYKDSLALQRVVITFLVYANELSLGTVSPTNADELFSLSENFRLSYITKSLSHSGDNSDSSDKKIELFIQRYGKIILDQLIDLRFIAEDLSGDNIDLIKAKKEIETYLRKGESTEIVSLNQLASFMTLEFGDLITCVSDVISYAQEGLYNPKRYSYIASLLNHLFEIFPALEEKFSDSFDRLQNGLIRSVNQVADTRSLSEFQLNLYEKNLYVNKENIEPRVERIIEQTRNLLTEKLRAESLNRFYEYLERLESIQEDQRGKEYQGLFYKEYLSEFNVEKLASILVLMKNRELHWVEMILSDIEKTIQSEQEKRAFNNKLKQLANILESRWNKEHDPLAKYVQSRFIEDLMINKYDIPE